MLKKFGLIGFSSALALTFASCGNANTQSTKNVDLSNLAAEPVIWSVTDEDSEIILYPTFHILPKGIKWQSETLTAALGRAEEIWYEIPVGAENDPAFQKLTMQLGVNPDQPLSETLPEETYTKLKTVAADLGVPIQNFEPMRPWLVSVTIPVIQMMKSGYNPNLGVEAVLQSQVKNLPVKNFETAEQQLRFFSEMPDDEQIDMLDSALDDIHEGQAMVDKMAKAWASGDLDMLQTEILDEMKSGSPGVYDILIKKRNDAWVKILEAEMAGSGVDFVAVGAGHLIGEDGVPEQLLEKGYSVKVLTKAAP